MQIAQLFIVATMTGLLTSVQEVRGNDNLSATDRPKSYFERSFTLSRTIKLHTRATERECTPKEIADLREDFKDRTGFTAEGYKSFEVTGEFEYANRRTEVGIITQIMVPATAVEGTRLQMECPVVDVLLVDDQLYVLAKAGMSTQLLVLKDVRNYVAGGRRYLVDVAVDSYGSGINPPKPDDVPVCVGFLRGGKILSVKNHRVAKVELIGAEGERHLRDIIFPDPPADGAKAGK